MKKYFALIAIFTIFIGVSSESIYAGSCEVLGENLVRAKVKFNDECSGFTRVDCDPAGTKKWVCASYDLTAHNIDNIKNSSNSSMPKLDNNFKLDFANSIPSTLQAGSDILIEVNSTGSQIPDKIDLFINNTFIRTERYEPYQWNNSSQNDTALQNLQSGQYRLHFKAYAKNQLIESKSRALVIKPVVSSFKNNFKLDFSKSTPSTLESGDDLIVEVDSTGKLAPERIDLFINDTFIRRERHEPFQWNHGSQNDTALQNLKPGQYQLRYRAYINNYLIESKSRTLVVNKLQKPTTGAQPMEPVGEITDDQLLDLTQEATFKYFWDFAEVNSGAARERYIPSNPDQGANTVATGGSGFGLMSILIGIERGYVSRSAAIARLNTILDFFENADRFHGAWPHWINGTNGKIIPFSPLDNGGDLVETALLSQGLIAVKEYFKNGTPEEIALAEQADALWKGVEWNWYTQNQNVLYWHWSPNNGFAIDLELKGYNETLIAYVLAAASPNNSISKDVYTNGWASNGGIKSDATAYGYPLIVKHPGAEEAVSGPLFFSHYSFVGLNPFGLSDEYVNYGNAAVNHSQVQYNYSLENPYNFQDYGSELWGLTASYTRNPDGSLGYTAHSPANDTGVVSPTAAISSIPFTPKLSLQALRYFYENRAKTLGPAGFYDAISPEYDFWVAEAYLAIDQGPQMIMIENHRTGFMWKLFMQNPDIRAGLGKLGFSYGN